MIAVIQRVSRSSVSVEGKEIAHIGRGLQILVGVMHDDDESDVQKLVRKIVALRIFPNEAGKMDRNVVQIGGEALVVSQFTLAGRIKKGNRPDFSEAMKPQEAEALYEAFVAAMREHLPVSTGRFGAMMEVEIRNDGPVTIIADSKRL